jgi:glycosyltransferase involved in cell wall biosynthesis
MNYKSLDLSIIVPTYNRAYKLEKLLDSIFLQTVVPGRVIVVDGSDASRIVVESYAEKISVEYYQCTPPSQLSQRNFGIDLLRGDSKLIALLDDDIVLAPNCLEEMLNYWGSVEDKTAGISFNITNQLINKSSIIERVLGLSHCQPGKVLRSGMSIPISPAKQSHRVEWLQGGATVWRSEVLIKYKHKNVRSRWAIGEDLIYSYPIGKNYPLYVCAAACVRHEHTFNDASQKNNWYHGRTQTIWMHYFVVQNKDVLSEPSFLWVTSLRIAGKLLRGVTKGKMGDIYFVQGQLYALMEILKNKIGLTRHEDLRDEGIVSLPHKTNRG